MRTALFRRTGPPHECVEIAEVPLPEPGPGEVRLRMICAPVNPADLNFIEGIYGKKPALPAVPGMEGTGKVDAVGAGVSGIAPGAAAVMLQAGACWTEYAVCRAEDLFLLPDGIDLQQAAMLRVNPATALGLLRAAGELPAGSWVLQNAASSACGHCVIQLARLMGLRTVSLVRRAASMAECEALGADAVLTDDADAIARVRELTADAPAMLALNAVGGESAVRLLDLLGPGGTLVTYGAMSRQSLKVPNGFLIFKDVRLRGYWMTRWLETAPREELQQAYTTLAEFVAAGKLRQPVAAVYPFTRISEALAHAAQSGRGGKILLDLEE